jgi:para-aminobenzoate synthetase
VVMGLAHRTRPLWGVQFHPESVATEHGGALMANFLALAAARRRPRSPRPAPAPPAARRPAPPASPVTVRHRALPAWREPAAVFTLLHAGDDHVAWLDSARVEPGRARFSYLAAPAGPLGRVLRYDVDAGEVEVGRPGGGREILREPVLDTCRRLLADARCDAPVGPFDFVGGLVGYLGYELKADCGARRAHSFEHPDAALLFCDRVVAFDHLERRVHLLALAGAGGEGDADSWLAATARRLAAPAIPPPSVVAPSRDLRFTLRDDPASYLDNIAACRREIVEGETYEICLTTELRSPDALEPLGAYRALRARNPAAHAALLRLGELSVLSSSPERFLRVGRDRVVESGPIKGTAARLADPGQDAMVAARLRRDPKARAENLMIADLVRNDLGRVCAAGTVTVPRLMGVDTLATVHQLVTTVRGRLRPEADAVDAVRAAFPGGSMTGAPKLRTMEILDALEGRPRGVYAGALGFLSVNGTADLSIVIRTLVIGPDGVSAGSGGAIVAGSDPEAELAEMLLKARPLLAAVGGRLAGPARAATAR